VPAEKGQPDYRKLAGEFFAQNPTILAEAQRLLASLFKNKDAGKTGWGDIDPDTFRRKFTALIPEKIRRVYRKEIKGIDGVAFANFARDMVGQAQNYKVDIQTGPAETREQFAMQKPYSLEEPSALVQSKLATEVAKKSQVLDEILPEFNQNPVAFGYSDKIFQAAKKHGVAVGQAVRFLYEHFGFGDKFNELRKIVKPNQNLSAEQMLLRELVNLLEPKRQGREKKKEPASSFFISAPDKKSAHRSLIFDATVPDKPGTKSKTVRFSVQCPLGADIGKGQELYAIALEMAKLYNPSSMAERMALSARDFEQAWRKSQSPEEVQRIEKRAKFIKEAKPVFESNPEEFILNNKLAEFAAGIPNEEVIRYLADEEFIGEYRQKYREQFVELTGKSDTILAKFVGLDTQEAKKFTREQLLLKVVAELLKRAKIEAARIKKEMESRELAVKNMVEEETAEVLEKHPAVVAAKVAMLADFKEQMAGMDFTPEELGQDFERYWNKGLFKQLLEKLKQNNLI
jgi:hypothetical protein